MTSFPAFSRLFVQTASLSNKKIQYTAVQRHELHFVVQETTFYPPAALVLKLLFLPLQNKIHIFAPQCNFLYLFPTCLRLFHNGGIAGRET